MPLSNGFKVVPRNIREWSRWFTQVAVTPDDGTAGTAQLADEAVATAKLADSSVVTAKIADTSVTLAKLDDVATQTVLGRLTAGSGAVEALTQAQAADVLQTTDWVFSGEVQLNGTVGLFGVTPTAQIANIPDADTAHALNAVFSDVEVEAALDALGTKINSVIAAIEAIGITST